MYSPVRTVRKEETAAPKVQKRKLERSGGITSLSDKQTKYGKGGSSKCHFPVTDQDNTKHTISKDEATGVGSLEKDHKYAMISDLEILPRIEKESLVSAITNKEPKLLSLENDRKNLSAPMLGDTKRRKRIDSWSTISSKSKG